MPQKTLNPADISFLNKLGIKVSAVEQMRVHLGAACKEFFVERIDGIKPTIIEGNFAVVFEYRNAASGVDSDYFSLSFPSAPSKSPSTIGSKEEIEIVSRVVTSGCINEFKFGQLSAIEKDDFKNSKDLNKVELKNWVAEIATRDIEIESLKSSKEFLKAERNTSDAARDHFKNESYKQGDEITRLKTTEIPATYRKALITGIVAGVIFGVVAGIVIGHLCFPR